MENRNLNRCPVEMEITPRSGWLVLAVSTVLCIAATVGCILGGMAMDAGGGAALFTVSMVYLFAGWIPWMGLKVVRPNEALVLTLFGRYTGTIMREGFYFVNPFSAAAYPQSEAAAAKAAAMKGELNAKNATAPKMSKTISLKALTLDNQKQKVNDQMGNPIEVGMIVIWRVVSPALAVFSVDDYKTFVSIQADSALRDVARCYPYDCGDDDTSPSLRESSGEVSARIKEELDKRVSESGIEIIEARITHLAYSPEVAAAMLQRQQATAIIEARQKIVDGAVGMVEMALKRLSDGNICQLDDERKAQMVSNLLVVLCGNKDAQPVVNSGSIY